MSRDATPPLDGRKRRCYEGPHVDLERQDRARHGRRQRHRARHREGALEGGLFATPDVLGYATAKFGVFGFSEALRGELQPHDIGVSTICPGMIATNIIHTGRFRDGPKGQDLKAKIARTFEKRGHPPETVANAVVRAIETNRAVMPAAPEAWAFWYAKRLFPQRFAKVANWISRRTTQ